MFRKLICIALCLALLLCGCSHNNTGSSAETEAPSATPTPTPTQTPSPPPTPHPMPALFHNSEFIINSAPIVHNKTPYIPLTYAVKTVIKDPVIDQNNNRILIKTNELSITVNRWQVYVIANGRYLYNPTGVLFYDSTYYLPATLIAKILGVDIQFDDAGNVFFFSNGKPLVHGDTFYSKEDVFWLSHIINAESGNQSLKGKIAVGNVVLNRVNSPAFPNSIYDVLFQKGQFYPSYSGPLAKDPNYESIIAAKLCLDGAVVLSNAYWYNTVGTPSWASKNRKFITTIGDHSFYG